MPPLKRKNCYDPEWEKQYDFLKKSRRGDTFFFCSLCQNDFIMSAGINTVKSHQDSKMHKQIVEERSSSCKSPEQNNASKIAANAAERQAFTDSMFSQALKEASIDNAEKKIAALIDALLPTRQNVTKSAQNGRQIEPELLIRLRDLSAEMAAEERELLTRKAFLQRARDTFIRELTDYSTVLDQKMETMERMGEQYKELAASIERSALTGPELPSKPVMIDKEIQAIPERTLFRSPTAEMDFASCRLAQLPTSPVLRTTANKVKPPMDHVKTETITPRKILF